MIDTDLQEKTKTNTDEDRVVHAYESRGGVIMPGDPSACGLARWTGPPHEAKNIPPANFCSICDVIWRKEWNR